MQAILKNKHERFCNWLQRIKDKQTSPDNVLEGLENDIYDQYNLYLQKREEIRTIIQHYEEKQQAIRSRIKQRRRLYSKV
jgi:hypothetical protein